MTKERGDMQLLLKKCQKSVLDFVKMIELVYFTLYLSPSNA